MSSDAVAGTTAKYLVLLEIPLKTQKLKPQMRNSETTFCLSF